MKYFYKSKHSLVSALILGSLLVGMVLGGCFPAASENGDEITIPPTEIAQEIPDSTPTPGATANPFGDWTEYTNETIRFPLSLPHSLVRTGCLLRMKDPCA